MHLFYLAMHCRSLHTQKSHFQWHEGLSPPSCPHVQIYKSSELCITTALESLLITFFWTSDLAEPPMPSTLVPYTVAKYFHRILQLYFSDNCDTGLTVERFALTLTKAHQHRLWMCYLLQTLYDQTTCWWKRTLSPSLLSWLSVTLRNDWQAWPILYTAAVNKFMLFYDQMILWMNFIFVPTTVCHSKVTLQYIAINLIFCLLQMHQICFTLTCSWTCGNTSNISSFNWPTQPCLCR